jgi:hypothetical protein
VSESNVPEDPQCGEVSATTERAPHRWPLQVLLGSALALCAGVAIAWVDTRPGWDDTGVTAGALVIAAAASSFAGIPPSIAAALVVGPILVAELAGGMGVLLGIPFAVGGAYVGAFVRRHTLGR